MRDNTKVIFVHIPKTAGSTLSSILDRQYANVYKIYGTRKEGRERVNTLQTSLNFEQRQQIRLIRGHWPFGLHQYFTQPCVYISFLRNPVERTVSFYYHVLRTSSHYVYRLGFSRDMDLLTFLQRGFAKDEIQNGQSFFLTGRSLVEQEPREIIEFVENQYKFVGVSEYFDESLVLMKRLLGWKKNHFYYPRRVNQARAPLSALSDEVIELIEEKNQIDLDLYKHFAAKLQEQVHTQSGTVGKEVRIFKRMNGAYKAYVCVWNRVNRWRSVVVNGSRV